MTPPHEEKSPPPLLAQTVIDLYDTSSNALVGTITEAELEYLREVLEEESLGDTDYYFTADTIDLLTEDGGATDHLLKVLRDALGKADGVELRWHER
jgi:hypothetical protein